MLENCLFSSDLYVSVSNRVVFANLRCYKAFMLLLISQCHHHCCGTLNNVFREMSHDAHTMEVNGHKKGLVAKIL